MMNLYQLHSFVTVIAEGSMTGAADRLYLTQPAISQQIRNLEEELGVELLVRGVRQIKPTLQGEVLYDYAKKILQLTQQAEISVKSLGAELVGELRVGTLNSLGLSFMSPILSRLLKHNPALSVTIDYDLGPSLINAFKNRQLDVLILPEIKSQYEINLGEHVSSRFLMSDLMWLVGAGKDTAMPKQVQLEDLKKYPWIEFSKEFPAFNIELEKSLKTSGTKLQPVFRSPNVGTLKRVIESGLGWGFLPSSSVKKQVRMGRMNHVMVKDFACEIEYHFYARTDTTDQKLIDVLYQTLQQQDKT
jgi:DNA-binding transcriptional LysR family regulator